MRILFWGTPAYAVPSLEALLAEGHELVGVVSQPDRRRGRGGSLVASPVKERALAHGLPVFTPSRIRREPECQAALAALGADASVVVAFGQILPPEVLQAPPLGCWNGHGSLLPRWRGAAPIQWALLEGDPRTGVGIMAMEEGLDTGPVLLERSLTIGLLENASQLGARLAALTAELLVEALPRIEAAGPGPEAERWRRLGLRQQSSEGVTYARLLQRDDQWVCWNAPAQAVHRRILAMHPNAHALWQGKRLKLLASEPLLRRRAAELSPEGRDLAGRWGLEPGQAPTAPPGTVLEVVKDVGLVVATAGCPLLLREAQLEGKPAAGGGRLLQQLGAEPGSRLNDGGG
ncbi:MAG: methionyl-tRNA formyltransferase [Synechococcaceae cyanobacterium]|nr:methionyl-tRNA formyltransferase [Synechococcaceae cyanobacterium]